MIKEELLVKTTALPQSRVALELSINTAFCSLTVDNHFLEIIPPAEARTKSTFKNSSLVAFLVAISSPFHLIIFPSERSDESKTNSEMGKFLSSRILISSDPTAPEEPKTATFKGLFGKNGDFLTI